MSNEIPNDNIIDNIVISNDNIIDDIVIPIIRQIAEGYAFNDNYVCEDLLDLMTNSK